MTEGYPLMQHRHQLCCLCAHIVVIAKIPGEDSASLALLEVERRACVRAFYDYMLLASVSTMSTAASCAVLGHKVVQRAVDCRCWGLAAVVWRKHKGFGNGAAVPRMTSTTGVRVGQTQRRSRLVSCKRQERKHRD